MAYHANSSSPRRYAKAHLGVLYIHAWWKYRNWAVGGLLASLIAVADVALAADDAAGIDQALTVHVEAQDFLRKTVQPDEALLTLYIGAVDKSWTLQSMKLVVDESEPVAYQYSIRESKALQRGGLHRLDPMLSQRGDRRIYAEFTVGKLNGQQIGGREIIRIDEPLTVDAGVMDVELSICRSKYFGRLRKPRICIRQLDKIQAAALNNAGNYSGGHPRLRSAAYQTEAGDRLMAAAEVALATQPGIAPERFTNLPLTPNPSATDDDIYRAYNRAVAGLRSDSDKQSSIALLKEVASRDAHREDQLALIDKVNIGLGYYFLDRYRYVDAAEHFSRVRRHGPFASRALIGLGWSLMVPENIESDLVAEIGLGGSAQSLWFDSEDEIAKARRRTPFRHSWSVVHGEKRDDLLAAIVPWMELINGDAFDAAVQEGMLSIPYALTHLGDVVQAFQYYEKAMSRLRAVIDYYEDAEEKIAAGSLFPAIEDVSVNPRSGWDTRLYTLMDDPETEFLRLLMDGDNVVESLQRYTEVLRLRDRLEGDSSMLSRLVEKRSGAEDIKQRVVYTHESLEPEVRERREDFERALLAELRRKRTVAQNYLAEAGFAVARLYDNPRSSAVGYIGGGR